MLGIFAAAPELYIAIGLAGESQHTAGMKDSQPVGVINIDSDAAKFDVADYCHVADSFGALSEPNAELAVGAFVDEGEVIL